MVELLANALSPQRNASAFAEVFRLIIVRRSLVAELARRDMGAAHRRHGLGHLWIYIHPVLIALIFLFIFGFVLGSRINLPQHFPGDYSSYILIGLIPWLMTQAVLLRATSALTSRANLVKQVVFPIEVLPVSTVISTILPFIPSLLTMVLYTFVVVGKVPWTLVLLPAVLAMHFALAVGSAYILSSLTVFIRDLHEVMSVFCLVAMYITPAIYLPDWVPEPFRPFLYLNPFSYLIWVYQDTFFFGEIEHPEAWIVLAIISLGSLAGGFRLFKRLAPFFGNVL